MGKKYIFFEDPEQLEIFRGVYDINTMIKYISDYNIPPYEAYYVLIQCFTFENVETNLNILQEKLLFRYFNFLRTNIQSQDWETDYETIELPCFTHVSENGEFDPKYKEGVEALKNYFAENPSED